MALIQSITALVFGFAVAILLSSLTLWLSGKLTKNILPFKKVLLAASFLFVLKLLLDFLVAGANPLIFSGILFLAIRFLLIIFFSIYFSKLVFKLNWDLAMKVGSLWYIIDYILSKILGFFWPL